MARRSPAPSGAPTRAVQVLLDAGVPHRLLSFDAGADAGGPGLGEQAAEALGVPPERTFKTLMVALPDGDLAACCVPVSGRLDPRAAAAALGVKRVALAELAVAERRTGTGPPADSRERSQRMSSERAISRPGSRVEEVDHSFFISGETSVSATSSQKSR